MTVLARLGDILPEMCGVMSSLTYQYIDVDIICIDQVHIYRVDLVRYNQSKVDNVIIKWVSLNFVGESCRNFISCKTNLLPGG
jgi:hypothetical protein